MSEDITPKYKRILLKLSGEALAGDKKTGLDIPTIEKICQSIKKCYDIGTQRRRKFLARQSKRHYG